MHSRNGRFLGLMGFVVAGSILCLSATAVETGPELKKDYPYWRGKGEKTPGPFLCTQPDATNVLVVNDRWPDCSDLRQFGLDAIRLSGAKTDHEKALAVWRWMRRVKSHTNGQAPCDPLNPERSGGQVNDPIKIMNVHGAHWCSGLGRVTALIWRALGYEGHALHRSSHGMAALRYKDADGISRYHLFDCNFGGYMLDRKGERVLTADEFSTDYYMWMYNWYFGETWPMPTHRVDLAMRKGEGLKRLWGNIGKPFHNNVSAKDDRGTRKACEKGPYEVTFGNGQWTYSPNLSAPDWANGLAQPASGMANGKLTPARAGAPAHAIWHFRTPYTTVEAEIELKAKRKSNDDQLKLSLSVDNGKTWQECWKAPAGEIGDRTFKVLLNENFKIVYKKTKIPETLNSPFGRYAYRLKLELLAKGQPEDCSVSGVTFRSTVHQAIRALPQLWPGKNKITIKGKLAKGAALRVTYVWDDPAGKSRKNVTVAEELPYTYEILAAGGKWEDCACKELLIETIAATGKGSRTVVREKPTEIQKLPLLPPVAATRTRWVRQLHRGKKAPSSQDIINWLKEKRTIRSGLLWASELALPDTFEAVQKVAFDREICKKKGIKEVALIAMYRTDPKRARPFLLKIVGDVKCETGWKYSEKDPAVSGGHWMSGTCLVGQIAAEAGWKEFVPALAKALASKYCGSHQRMSILRSMTAIAGPGDKEAVEAARKSLALTHAYMLPQAALLAGIVGDKDSIPRLRELLDHPFLVVRRRAAIALGKLGDTESAPKLRESLFRIRKPEVLDHHKYGTAIWADENMRAAAAEALGEMGDKGSIPALRKALAETEPVRWVREKIKASLKKLGVDLHANADGAVRPMSAGAPSNR